MESVIFDTPLKKSPRMRIYLERYLNDRRVKQVFQSIEVFAYTEEYNDLNNPEIALKLEGYSNLIKFVIDYVWNILHRNTYLKNQGDLYTLSIDFKVSFHDCRAKIYLFLDDRIFGIVIGKRFFNVRNLIYSIGPILAKLEYESELRFFPASRQGEKNYEKL